MTHFVSYNYHGEASPELYTTYPQSFDFPGDIWHNNAMPGEKDCRVRLRWPSGAEFEAQGTAEFVASEGKDFLQKLQDAGLASAAEASGAPEGRTPRRLGVPQIAWDEITELAGRTLQLRAKLSGEKTERDACLVLMACAQKKLNEAKPTATQLAKWLRRSGYPVGRMDRALQDAVAQGEILASGSRRARRYELTASGRLKALLLAEALSQAVTALP